jgi:hypothetical protein
MWKKVKEELPTVGKVVIVAGMLGTTPTTGLAHVTGGQGKKTSWKIRRGSLTAKQIQQWCDLPEPPTGMMSQQAWNEGNPRPAHIARNPSPYLISRLRKLERGLSRSTSAAPADDSTKPLDEAE